MCHLFIDLKEGLLVEAFVQCIADLPGRFEIISGHGSLNAKSILGICSQDLSKPLLLRVQDGSEVVLDKLRAFSASSTMKEEYAHEETGF